MNLGINIFQNILFQPYCSQVVKKKVSVYYKIAVSSTTLPNSVLFSKHLHTRNMSGHRPSC